MIRGPCVLVLAAALMCAVARADTFAPTQTKKDIPMESAKRRAPAAQPVVHKGIRYEQLRRPMDQGFDQAGGVIVAIDAASGRQVWVTQLFKTDFVPKEEKDAQEVYVSQLVFDAKAGFLMATDERKRRWRINPADGSAAPMSPAPTVKLSAVPRKRCSSGTHRLPGSHQAAFDRPRNAQAGLATD